MRGGTFLHVFYNAYLYSIYGQFLFELLGCYCYEHCLMRKDGIFSVLISVVRHSLIENFSNFLFEWHVTIRHVFQYSGRFIVKRNKCDSISRIENYS